RAAAVRQPWWGGRGQRAAKKAFRGTPAHGFGLERIDALASGDGLPTKPRAWHRQRELDTGPILLVHRAWRIRRIGFRPTVCAAGSRERTDLAECALGRDAPR